MNNKKDDSPEFTASYLLETTVPSTYPDSSTRSGSRSSLVRHQSRY